MNVNAAPPGPTVHQAARRPRDPRLDFFRGVGMFIILIAHIPWNSWTSWIPARFGFSDAAELFVFCSGMASAIAFGGVYRRRGWLMGTARILLRVWQVYWAHIASFFLVLALLSWADLHFGEDRYLKAIQLDSFFAIGPARIMQTMTLTFLPPFFEILPMYLCILAMIPVVMALARVHVRLVFVWMIGLWLLANIWKINLPAQPEGGRDWFFNPLAWQLVFFSGFALMSGWIPAPPRDRRLVWLCVAIVVAAAPFSCRNGFSCYQGWGYFPVLSQVQDWLGPVITKTDEGLLRYIHFMATVYLAWYLAGEHGSNLKGAAVDVMIKVGQQTLAVFLTGLVVAHALGIFLDRLGRGFFVTGFANLLGLAILVAAAYLTAWFKSSPWLEARKAHDAGGFAAAPQAAAGGDANADPGTIRRA